MLSQDVFHFAAPPATCSLVRRGMHGSVVSNIDVAILVRTRHEFHDRT